MKNIEKVEALMKEVSGVWQIDCANGKTLSETLEGFSLAHRIAMRFGNFNYQVYNGGILVYISNRYFADAYEDMLYYLKKGAETDYAPFARLLETFQTLSETYSGGDYDDKGNCRTRCDACDGDGTEDCITCGGLGVLGDDENDNLSCGMCGGDGSTPCDECGGSGEIVSDLWECINADEFDSWYDTICDTDEHWCAVVTLIERLATEERN